LELAERPWVDANVSIDGPLTYDVNGARFQILITLRNTGRSPAFNTSIHPKMIVTFGPEEAMKVREQLCGDAESSVNTMSFGTTLFPDVQFPNHMAVYLAKKDYEDAKRVWKGQLGENIVGPTLVFCIAYRPTFSPAVYKTSYIFDVLRIDKTTNLPQIQFPYGEPIDAEHLRIRLGVGSIVAK
jgi:hypothetical protein